MAGRNLVTTSKPPSPASQPANDENDVWQGYSVRWTNTGLEITAPTSSFPYGPLLIGGAVGVIVMLMMIVNIPDANRGQSMLNPALWILAFFVAIIPAGLIAAPFYILPASWTRSTALETLEIRPDGITVNRQSFFPRNWIHRIGVERLKGDTSDYPWAVIGIIGTKQMTLLAGFDDPTAEVIAHAVEQAKRQLWQEVR